MTRAQREQAEELFYDISLLEPENRRHALSRISDSEVHAEVESLLRHMGDGVGGLDTAIAQVAQAASFSGAFGDRAVGPGTRFENYRIERKIGQGGMGDVYEAVRESDFHKRVALKIVRYGLDTAYARTRFQQERQVLAGLEHPFIARLLDGGEASNGCPYLVLEFIEGVAIDTWCQARPREAILRLFLKVCESVEYAHRNLVIHRDLKPANILVTDEGNPKLLDFGIAKLLDPRAEVTLTRFVALTPQYASPEQVRGETVTTASDVYSLGVILYQLLTGRKPYEVGSATTALEMDRVICREAPATPGIGNELDHILLMALRKEPGRRYPGVLQFAQDIERYLEGSAVLAAPDTFLYRATKFASRYKVGIAAVVALVMSLTAGLVSTLYQQRRAERRFQDVRSLANTFLFDFHDKIRSLPGSTEAREMVVTTALKYLDKLSLEAGNDPALLYELQSAYARTGEVQGDPSNPSLGHAEQAMKSFRRSVEIGERLRARGKPEAAVLDSLGTTYYRMGTLQQSEADSREAVLFLQKCVNVAEEIKRRGKVPVSLTIRCYSGLGYSQSAIGDTSGALASVRHALATEEDALRTQSTIPARRGLALLRVHLGQILADTGDLEASLREFQGSAESVVPFLAKGEELHRHGFPEVVAFAYYAAGRVSGNPLAPNLGNPVAAVSYYEKSLALREAVVLTDPNDGTARENLADSQIWMGDVLSEVDSARAIQMYRKGIATTQQLAAHSPASHSNDFRLALAHFGLGRLASMRGQSTAAGELKEALRIQRTFRPEQMSDSESKRLLARTLTAIGSSASLREAVEIAGVLWKDHPRELDAMLVLGETYEALGDAARKSKSWAEAREWYGKSRDLWSKWPQHGTSTSFDLEHAKRAAKLVEQCNVASGSK